ncbi:Golgi Transport [Dimargaris cristalligena]|uniref:Vesicle transport protein n=1 Tax=Dimargaris cristalligena TaxID=215637 RepID=A0A4V1J5P1_9FUNG|nr:Golgi Transport [Dimargaris cristalligena]RKP39739.1 vesicle transport protein [Dimargaris cristalligena]|eukprot:RKP39739.1 vesicle transport protein [Dimargaris cristalligena]
MWLSDSQKLGVGLSGFGIVFTFLGVLLFFDAGLIALGNVMFLAGVTLIIGLQKSVYFFARPGKIRGTICFFAGIILVFVKWPVIGLLVEGFGFINLFGDFFPVVISFLQKLPVIGSFLALPGVSQVANRLAGVQSPV